MLKFWPIWSREASNSISNTRYLLTKVPKSTPLLRLYDKGYVPQRKTESGGASVVPDGFFTFEFLSKLLGIGGKLSTAHSSLVFLLGLYTRFCFCAVCCSSFSQVRVTAALCDGFFFFIATFFVDVFVCVLSFVTTAVDVVAWVTFGILIFWTEMAKVNL